jgi:hypothetical protein
MSDCSSAAQSAHSRAVASPTKLTRQRRQLVRSAGLKDAAWRLHGRLLELHGGAVGGRALPLRLVRPPAADRAAEPLPLTRAPRRRERLRAALAACRLRAILCLGRQRHRKRSRAAVGRYRLPRQLALASLRTRGPGTVAGPGCRLVNIARWPAFRRAASGILADRDASASVGRSSRPLPGAVAGIWRLNIKRRGVAGWFPGMAERERVLGRFVPTAYGRQGQGTTTGSRTQRRSLPGRIGDT